MDEARVAFYDGSREVNPLVVNDAVEVVDGENKGASGAVISIEQVTPEFIYLVEKGDGSGDLLVPLGSLRLVE